MLKSESAVEIRLEKHLSRRGQLVIYWLLSGDQQPCCPSQRSSTDAEPCLSYFLLLTQFSAARLVGPISSFCSGLRPDLPTSPPSLLFHVHWQQKKSNIFLAKNEVICWLEILIFFALLPSAPLPLLTKASAAAARWCRFFTWLYDFVTMIDISGENSFHIELVYPKVTMFLCHLYPPKGDYSFGHVIFKNTLKKTISDFRD